MFVEHDANKSVCSSPAPVGLSLQQNGSGPAVHPHHYAAVACRAKVPRGRVATGLRLAHPVPLQAFPAVICGNPKFALDLLKVEGVTAS